MHIEHNTTATPTQTLSRVAHLRAGDSVLVWDGVKGRNLWQSIAEIRSVEGRVKIRVEGTDFFFDEALIVSYAASLDREVA